MDKSILNIQLLIYLMLVFGDSQILPVEERGLKGIMIDPDGIL